MDDNLNIKILESYVEIDKIHDEINNKIFNFVTRANELVKLSDDDYRIEKTLMLNKISLKGYILESDLCIQLEEKNITDYSIDELKNYLTQYENLSNVDYSNYLLALSLYEQIEEIESLVDKKINLEIYKFSRVISDLNDIKTTEKDDYEQLYLNIKNRLDNYYNSKQLNEKSYNICIQTVNDIFNFYISGYPNIPDEYLYHE